MQNVEKTIRRATASTVPEPQRPSGRISRNDNARPRAVQVVQNIYANETSYALQQREAAKQFRLVAREVRADGKENEKLIYTNERGESITFSHASIFHTNEVSGLSDVRNEIYSINSMGQDGDTYLGNRHSIPRN